MNLMSPMKKYKQDQSLSLQQRQGLPNLGNTCYINSILQFLYSSHEFNKKITHDKRVRKEDTPFAHQIKEIFQAISSGENESVKASSLRNFIQLFHQFNKDVYCYFEQDILQILFMLLNQLFQEIPDFRSFFEIQIENSCGCGSFRMATYLMDDSSERWQTKCFGCSKRIKTKILSQSQLMIVRTNHQNSNSLSFCKQFQRPNSMKSLLYRCIGKIFYRGSGSAGHYTASRICGESEQFIEFNDLQASYEKNQGPTFLLYQKISQLDNAEKRCHEKSVKLVKLCEEERSPQTKTHIVIRLNPRQRGMPKQSLDTFIFKQLTP